MLLVVGFLGRKPPQWYPFPIRGGLFPENDISRMVSWAKQIWESYIGCPDSNGRSSVKLN